MKLENSIYEIRLQMFRYGGNFVRQLASCIGAADLENQGRIVAAFPEIMERYDALATLEKKEQPELEVKP
jgi:hypothetical protein